MGSAEERQESALSGQAAAAGPLGNQGVIPNPKLKLLDQVGEVLRVKHYSIRTERCYCD
jgi:hypothetical protein